MKYRIIYLFLFIQMFTSQVRAERYNDRFYDLYIKGEMTDWVNLLDKAKADYTSAPNKILLEDIIRAQYGLIAFYVGGEEDEKAIAEIEVAQKYLKKLASYYPDEAWVIALSASFDSFKVVLSPYRFFLKGPGVLSAINKSSQMDPENPDVMFLKANQVFYLPSILGGDQQKGLELYAILEKHLYQEDIQGKKNWFSLMYLTSYGLACSYAKDFEQSAKVYTKILKAEPGYDWVAKELLPQAEKKSENVYLKKRDKKMEGVK